ncbi:cytochrome P450 [Actinosynnema mirum]|uniref:Cytochrome P450 n=1 Tax=Actinosynnema mirum (strain ATCC 29888 / DSM 43827 / JCM 3225 / NBRC 14064 / NCIMB 13271 / NRRL B-12336 / IMRU 3971 / 101) TaxID=446462 RepID=C6WG22_ACTMD|nr:cytochrome P450 [Actinosynnema mirum]ACU37958.1 cytochrome P450 [Actinosynnema mirum DSM 43827]
MTAVRPVREFPGPPARQAPALLARMARDRLEVMTSVAARYGDAVRLRLGPKSLHFFNHPDHAKHVLADHAANYRKGIGLVHARRALGDGLLTSEGEKWKAQRRTIGPGFQARRVNGKADAIAQEAVRLVARLRARAGDGPVDVSAEMTGLTLAVLGRSLLDADLGAFDSVGASFEAVQDQAMFEMMTLSALPTWLPLPRQLRFRRARADLEQVVARLAAERAAIPGPDGDDVLTRLVESVRGEADPRAGRLRMRDELVTLLLAGHETTASTLSWTFHLLDRHPEVWERVHAEAVEVLGDRVPTFEDVHRLRYTGMVLQEVMRLYPAVWLLPRQAREADEIGGYPVPAGADVLICPYTLHRHPGLWEDPDRFDPERFDPARAAGRPRYAYLPFGAGPRVCVGSALGVLEATIVTACVARELRLSTAPGHRVRAEPMLTLRVRGGLPMRVRPVR